MEAASARMAARDRFSQAGDSGPTPLQRFIQQACSPEYFEPNLSLNLEIADLINSKKGNAPREAAVAIVNYINHRNPNVALLALSLLDICVKNCGYPFQLQVGTKEFLNELVRRFPERPPVRATRVQLRILEAIEEWKSTICQTSRYKEDLGFIRDMHRLLSYKGYTFPQVRREDAAVLNPSDVSAFGSYAVESICGTVLGKFLIHFCCEPCRFLFNRVVPNCWAKLTRNRTSSRQRRWRRKRDLRNRQSCRS